MKKALKKMAIASVIVMSVFVNSCTKSSNGTASTNYATQFVGTWTIQTSSCGSTGSFALAAGSSANSLTTSGTAGSGSCAKAFTVSGTATATGFNFPATTVTDGCGNSYTVSETGVLSGSTLTISEVVTGFVNSSCTGTATK